MFELFSHFAQEWEKDCGKYVLAIKLLNDQPHDNSQFVASFGCGTN